ncbi:hypothetical protein B296_00000091 [Ensete ventricosum]|uniref:Uncharacterized protein n=1 Tax=Ensete ventricosum TaxID=4639 RepID=A0A427B2S7_ENSVE|nr:hypothetical protein B296_00000091 [Ensete ventricosum]
MRMRRSSYLEHNDDGRSDSEPPTIVCCVKCSGQITSADNHPLLRRRGERGGWEMESLLCGTSASFTSSGRRVDVERSVSISLVLSGRQRKGAVGQRAEVIAGGSRWLHSSSRGLRLRLKKRAAAMAKEERRELPFDSTVARSRVRWDLLPFDSEKKSCSRQATLIQ